MPSSIGKASLRSGTIEQALARLIPVCEAINEMPLGRGYRPAHGLTTESPALGRAFACIQIRSRRKESIVIGQSQQIS
jgi:hypothetical protein